MNDSPLSVSVCVITYNSSKSVLETLNSVFSQTYNRIELIICDDCSTDNTVMVCQHWLDEHNSRFQNTKLIVQERNRGVAHNLNTAILASSGDWIKTVAGDDLLLPDCIADNLAFVGRDNSANIVFSKSRDFYDRDGVRIITDALLPDEYSKKFFFLSAKEQHDVLVSYNFVPATTHFLRRTFAINNLFQEQYSFCEDWPQWFHLTARGEKLYFFDKETVLYRKEDSLSRANGKCFVNPRFFDSYKTFFYTDRYEALKKLNPDAAQTLRKEFIIGEIGVVYLHNRRNSFTKGILFIIKRILGIKKIHFFQ